jgi:hypothetical protein
MSPSNTPNPTANTTSTSNYLSPHMINSLQVYTNHRQRIQGFIRTIEALAYAHERVREITNLATNIGIQMAALEPFLKDAADIMGQRSNMHDHLHRLQDFVTTNTLNRADKRLHSLQCLVAEALGMMEAPDSTIAAQIRVISTAYADTDPFISHHADRPRSPIYVPRSPTPYPESPTMTAVENEEPMPIPEPSPTIKDEVIHLLLYLSKCHPPSALGVFKPNNFHTLRINGERDKQYWETIVRTFLEEKGNDSGSYQGVHVRLYRGGLDHAPFFIGQKEDGQALISPVKRAVVADIVRGIQYVDSDME